MTVMTSSTTAVQTLAAEECWQLLATTSLGRVGWICPDGVDIVPVNVLARRHLIYFSSAPGSKLSEIVKNPRIAFEVDGVAHRQRWSVVVKGEATRLDSDVEIQESGVMALHSFTPVEKWNYIRIDPYRVSGRRFTSARRSA